jgi:hypothetical protein
MPKPTTARTEPKYAAPPAKRIRAERIANNEYRLVEEVWETPPTSTKVLMEKCSGIGAQERVRLWMHEHVGANFYGDSGL